MESNLKIDLNADVGEGMVTDEILMNYISSANIACGYHAGNEEIIQKTIGLCKQYQVAVGVHPSFADRENFGRKEQQISSEALAKLVMDQLIILQNACEEQGIKLHHVKPHGALYNMSARDQQMARVIAETIFSFNPALILYGLSGSHSIAEGVMAGLKTVAEVFADRSYQADGSLTSRSEKGALIENIDDATEQALMLVKQGKVRTMEGRVIPMLAESICLHGDGPIAVKLAKHIHQTFIDSNIEISPIF